MLRNAFRSFDSRYTKDSYTIRRPDSFEVTVTNCLSLKPGYWFPPQEQSTSKSIYILVSYSFTLLHFADFTKTACIHHKCFESTGDELSATMQIIFPLSFNVVLILCIINTSCLKCRKIKVT